MSSCREASILSKLKVLQRRESIDLRRIVAVKS